MKLKHKWNSQGFEPFFFVRSFGNANEIMCKMKMSANELLCILQQKLVKVELEGCTISGYLFTMENNNNKHLNCGTGRISL